MGMVHGLGGSSRFRQNRQNTIKHTKMEHATEARSSTAWQADSVFLQVTDLRIWEVMWTS